jgi:hypothetical protein
VKSKPTSDPRPAFPPAWFWDSAGGRFIRSYHLPRDRFTVKHVHCGLHSGLPDCCILFYITCWWPLTLAESDDDEGNPYRDLLDGAGGRGSGYVPCPGCLAARNFVEVRPCDAQSRRAGDGLCRPTQP